MIIDEQQFYNIISKVTNLKLALSKVEILAGVSAAESHKRDTKVLRLLLEKIQL